MALKQLLSDSSVVHIRPARGVRPPDLRELWQYRDLFYFLVWRNIKVRYAQSVLGVGWAVIQPVLYMVVFTVVFGKLAKVGSDGVPYAIFTYTALVPWTYFANAMTDSTGALIQNSNMLTKVYFPRLIMPLSAIVGKLVDFSIALLIVFALMAWYRIPPTQWAVLLPFLAGLMVLTAGGIGAWLAALAVQYRDIKYGAPFLAQILMYAAPVVYSIDLIPHQYRLLYAMNPMVGVIEGFRAALIGSRQMPWDMLAVGTLMAVIIAVSGLLYFRHTERIFADVV